MLSKSMFIMLFFTFSYAFTQSDRPKQDTVVSYKRTLAECKNAADSIAFYKANAKVNLALLKLRNDSAISRMLRDSIAFCDSSKIKQ